MHGAQSGRILKCLLPALRPFAPADLDPLIECWHSTWHRAFAPRRHPDPPAVWRERFLTDYASQSETWVMPAALGVAGFLILFPETKWVEQLFVRPDYQGRGYGRALVALARFRSPEELALDTPAENFPAREFYRRRGFVAQRVGFDPVNERVTLRYVWRRK